MKALDRMTRKVLTMNDFTYFLCKERCLKDCTISSSNGGRELISC